MPVLRNIGFLATCRMEGGQDQIHPVRNAALAWQGDKITWLGKDAELPIQLANEPAFDAGKSMVVPGLVECHTHLGFAGWRADEFEKRIQGQTYLEIAREGGGILRTVDATRRISEENLLARCGSFVDEMTALGITTIEAKSGYGLNLEDELKILRVYDRLRQTEAARIVSTCLSAHVVPPEYSKHREGYVDLICNEIIPIVAEQKLADFCDVFIEESAFSLNEARQIFRVAREFGLPSKLHADQLTDGQGAILAAQIKAVSADHLEHSSTDGIRAMAHSGTTAVALPLAGLYLDQPPFKARRFIEEGVSVAISTDFNPGTAPSFHLPLAMMLACTRSKMTPFEALKGVTIYAAKALSLEEEIGSIEVGKSADFAVIEVEDPNHWMYHFRENCCVATFIKGIKVHSRLN